MPAATDRDELPAPVGKKGRRKGTSKRKSITRNTDEILFFITPRIYRPDYQGRRVESVPSTGMHSVQIPQPVPLGNPGTNTPPPNSPTQQQQQQQEQPAVQTTLPPQPANSAPPQR